MLIKHHLLWKNINIKPSDIERRIIVYSSVHNNPYRIVRGFDLKMLTDAEFWAYLTEPKSQMNERSTNMNFDLTNYLKAGYGIIFIETTEIKRAIQSVTFNGTFKKIYWNPILGIMKDQLELNNNIECDPMEIIEKATSMERTAIILENFDEFLENFQITQSLLNVYALLKSNQTCLVIVGTNSKTIPTALKEFIPVIDFKLPDREEISVIAHGLSESASEAAKAMLDEGKFSQKDYDAIDYSVTGEVIDACQGMSYEEIENVLAYSAITNRSFNLLTILDRKRQVIKQTGFMDFLEVLPIETLGGLELFKQYFKSRIEPFKNPDSIKPKIKSVLLVGFQGTGKSHAIKCLCSLLEWPGIMLDIGGLKGSLVGETEKNTRMATKTIDAFGKCVVAIDEIEKAFGGTGKGMAHETSEGILGHFLTWMQERKTDAIVVATANNLDILPPEFLRSGRWDAIFFVNLPNPNEIKNIIDIKNTLFKSKLPNDKEFCNQLYKEKWSGAEIEQLAKDSHYDELDNAMKQIPILAQYRENELNKLKEKASIYRNANSNMKIKNRLKVNKRKLALK